MAPSHWDAICLEYKCRTFTPLPPRVYTTRKDPCFPKRAKPRDFLGVGGVSKLTNVVRSGGKGNWFRWGESMNTKGQSLIELIVVFPVMIAFWASLVWFSQISIVSIELMHTARHGVFWLAYNNSKMSKTDEIQAVRNECTAFLYSQAPSLDMRRITITIQPGDRWKAIGPKILLAIPKLLMTLSGTFKKNAVLFPFHNASLPDE